MTGFLKMHGLGNDFVVFDARRQALALTPAQIVALADRRTGIGCDQVIVIEATATGTAMRIHNSDGSTVESCGNAARCVAALLLEEHGAPAVRLETLGGTLVCTAAAGGQISVDMGRPRLDWQEIPLAAAVDTRQFELDVEGVGTITASAVSMGNPHCVIVTPAADAAPVASLGPRIERNALFPARTNVEFVEVRSAQRLRMRVWERGSGITRACGTGACASAVALSRLGRCGRTVEIELDGGMLKIDWRDDDHVLMTGPVARVFAGEIDMETWP